VTVDRRLKPRAATGISS